MAVFKEDFLRCVCGHAKFVAKEILVIHENAARYKRDYKTVPLPENLMEKEIIYVCEECGKPLDI